VIDLAGFGTPGYMSPEQVKGKPADARSDIFSFGAILYEMLSGQRAFHGDSAAETMSAILREEPAELSMTNPSVSPGLERIVRHSIEKSPEQRFHSAHDVAFALETAMGTPSAPQAFAASPKRRWSAVRLVVTAGAVAAALGAGILLGLRLGAPSPPKFRRLSYHRAYIESARFSPDGQTVYYGSTRRNQPLQIESTRLDAVESRTLDVPPGATVLGISRSGEMALLLGCTHHGYWIRSGTLARVALGGGVPREILEHVTDADISPDGKDFVVVREVGRLQRLEFPVGKLILETDGWISHPRISPDGSRVAFLEHPSYGDDSGFVSVASSGGKPLRVTERWQGAQGLAWRPDGREVWFAAGTDAVNGARYQLRAVTPDGESRLVYGPPADLWLHDISSTGAVLFAREDPRGELGGLLKGDTKERNLSTWSDEVVVGISADGSIFAGIEQAAPGAGLEPFLYYRRAGDTAPVRLGVGRALGISPDGRWVASRTDSERGVALTLLPTGPGDPRPLPLGNVRPAATPSQISARWSVDGRVLLFSGSEQGRLSRAWLLDLTGAGPPRAATPEGCGVAVLSPDGGSVATVDTDGRLLLCSVGGLPKEIRGALPGELPLEWEDSGKALFLWDRTWPARIVRLELESGHRSEWRELAPDPTGLLYGNVILTRDGLHYVYRVRRVLSELNVAEGLK
jgi:Tol biopolymer transport system component